MLRGSSSSGLFQIAFALRKNKSMKHLFLRNNGIDDTTILELAHSLMFSRSMMTMDFTGNPLNREWFQPNTFIRCKVLDEMPSIRTSLDKIQSILNDASTNSRYFKKPDIHIDPEDEGRWTHRGKWKKRNFKLEQSNAAKAEEIPELNKMAAETNFIDEGLARYETELRKFTSSSEGARFLSSVTKVISLYFQNLSLPVRPKKEKNGEEKYDNGVVEDDFEVDEEENGDEDEEEENISKFKPKPRQWAKRTPKAKRRSKFVSKELDESNGSEEQKQDYPEVAGSDDVADRNSSRWNIFGTRKYSEEWENDVFHAVLANILSSAVRTQSFS